MVAVLYFLIAITVTSDLKVNVASMNFDAPEKCMAAAQVVKQALEKEPGALQHVYACVPVRVVEEREASR